MHFIRITDEVSVAGQMEAADFAEASAAGFRTVVNNRPDGEQPGQPTAEEGRRAAEAAGLSYKYIPFTAATLSAAEVRDFARVLDQDPGPFLVHCRSGARSSTLWALAEFGRGTRTLDEILTAGQKAGIDYSGIPALAQRLGIKPGEFSS